MLASTSASAFGQRGHEIVAQLATHYLSEDAEDLIKTLYGDNYRRLLLEDAWFAERLTRQRGNEWRLGYHYTWFNEGDDGFDPDTHCPQGVCSVAAVLSSEQVLTDPDASRNQRLNAFRFLVHYMADLHDPTNAGFAYDRGGRETELIASNLERPSLHEVWQQELFDHLPHPPFVMANLWSRTLSDEQRQEWQQGEPASWVWETHEVARDLAYPLAESAGGWNAIYRREAMPALEEQLKKAAVRLALRLNMIASGALDDLAPAEDPMAAPDLMDFD